jgi:hypothetical protein
MEGKKSMCIRTPDKKHLQVPTEINMDEKPYIQNHG